MPKIGRCFESSSTTGTQLVRDREMEPRIRVGCFATKARNSASTSLIVALPMKWELDCREPRNLQLGTLLKGLADDALSAFAGFLNPGQRKCACIKRLWHICAHGVHCYSWLAAVLASHVRLVPRIPTPRIPAREAPLKCGNNEPGFRSKCTTHRHNTALVHEINIERTFKT